MARPIQGVKVARAIADKKTAPLAKEDLDFAMATPAHAIPVSTSVKASAIGSKGFKKVIQG